MKKTLLAALLLGAALPISMSGGVPVTRIHDIQGAGHISPLVGTSVTNVEGIVFLVVSNGFYMLDPSPDASDETSEGIFVFTSSSAEPSLSSVRGARRPRT